MRIPLTRFFLLSVMLGAIASRAGANIGTGVPAPGFTKNQLAGGPGSWTKGTAVSLSDYAGKVVVLFMLGYSWPFCLTDGPSVQADIDQHYRSLYPGEVVVLGVDYWAGTPTQVGSFKSQTGVTFPLLLCGDRCIGAAGFCGTTGSNCTNLDLLYGPYDNYIVIDTQGIVRYHAANIYDHGNRYHLQEIRACVDTLVPSVVGVGDAPLAHSAGPALRVAPNPFRFSVAIEIVNPGTEPRPARVTVHDLTGRIVATPLDGFAAPGSTHVGWDGRGPSGGRSAPGIYLVRAQMGSAILVRRLVWLRWARLNQGAIRVPSG